MQSVSFFWNRKPDVVKSRETGKDEYKNELYIKFMRPRRTGMTDIFSRKATEEDKQSYEREYKAFETGLDFVVDGTPLTSCPAVTSEERDFLYTLNIRSVEDAANMSEADAEQGYNRKIKERCAKFLEARNDTSAVYREVEALKDSVASLTEMVKDKESEIKYLAKALEEAKEGEGKPKKPKAKAKKKAD